MLNQSGFHSATSAILLPCSCHSLFLKEPLLQAQCLLPCRKKEASTHYFFLYLPSPALPAPQGHHHKLKQAKRKKHLPHSYLSIYPLKQKKASCKPYSPVLLQALH